MKTYTTAELTDKLTSAFTRYDAKQQGKRGHNPYALGHYLGRIADIKADIEAGANPREAIIVAFSGRLQDLALRSIGEPIASDKEQVARLFYVPASSNS
jgi:hypothetical protein